MRPSSLIAVVTANVWTKTELLLQTLTANRDAFEVLVSAGARQTLLRPGRQIQLPSVSHDMARHEAGLQATRAAPLLMCSLLHVSHFASEFLQVIDELSDDETPQRLHQYGVRIVTPPERLGVTYNWNIVSCSYPLHDPVGSRPGPAISMATERAVMAAGTMLCGPA